MPASRMCALCRHTIRRTSFTPEALDQLTQRWWILGQGNPGVVLERSLARLGATSLRSGIDFSIGTGRRAGGSPEPEFVKDTGADQQSDSQPPPRTIGLK